MSKAKRCIFCLQEKPLTDEHVVLKALGGTMAEKIVCKECNSRFGDGLDADFCKQIHNRLSRFTNCTTGRAHRVKAPFEGMEGAISGAEVRVVGDKNFGFKIASSPKIEIEKDKIRVNAAFPSNVSNDYIQRTLEEAVRKAFCEKIPTISEDKLEKEIANVMASFNSEAMQRIRADEVVYRETINIGVWELSFEKIAYEMASLLFGEEYYLNSPTADSLRKEILLADYKAEHFCYLFPKIPIISQLMDILDRQGCNVVIIIDEFVHIQVSGIQGVVLFEKDNPKFINSIFESKIFIFKRSESNCGYEEHNFCDWLKMKRNESAEFKSLINEINSIKDE